MLTSRKLYNHDMRWRKETETELLGGVDEAGRGALAGPVVVACVVLGPEARLRGVNDSKLLKHEQRMALVPDILREARGWAIGWASAAMIDQINILEATLRAAGEAVSSIEVTPQCLLTDFLKLKHPPCRCVPLVDGDALSLAIAAASVLAKVARDEIMVLLDGEYPQYGLATHKGYGTTRHWQGLADHGPSTLHRMTFRGVAPEPFFGMETIDAPARLRCASFAALAGHSAPAPDWPGLLQRMPAALNPHCFLPECEWN